MFKIKGIDKLQKDLKEAQVALGQLDGELGTISFDPNDPASIEDAIDAINRMIDERAGAYIDNPIVGPIVEQMKERYRENILQKAAEARLNQEGGT